MRGGEREQRQRAETILQGTHVCVRVRVSAWARVHVCVCLCVCTCVQGRAMGWGGVGREGRREEGRGKNPCAGEVGGALPARPSQGSGRMWVGGLTLNAHGPCTVRGTERSTRHRRRWAGNRGSSLLTPSLLRATRSNSFGEERRGGGSRAERREGVKKQLSATEEE